MTKFSAAPLCMLAVTALSSSFAAQTSAPAFEKVPAAALVALAETRGRPFMHGVVFVNGRYIAPPYVISRYGTALAVNGVQITGQLVPWSAFLATQSNVSPSTVTHSTVVTSVPVSGKKAESSAASTVDDLFGDDAPAPAPAAPAPGSSASAAAPVAEPSVKFVPNTRSDLLLKRLNTMRTDLDRSLRDDQFFFFSTKYARVNGNSNTALELLNALPEALRDATDADDLQSRLRAAGVTYIGPEVCSDLIAHRFDYPALIERRRKMKADTEALRLLQQEGSTL